MLKNVKKVSRDLPAKTNENESIVPDLWQDPDTDPTTPPLPETWQLPLNFHRSIAQTTPNGSIASAISLGNIAPTGNPDAL